MKCIKCGFEVNPDSQKCPNCGSNAAAMKKLAVMSAKHYNNALSCAKYSNLTQAAKELELSVGYNKLNTQAHNLLGLVYLETGEAANALKQWLLSANYQKHNNPAKEYLSYASDNITEFDKMDIGIKMYNEALTQLKRRYRQTEDADKLRRILETTADKLNKALEMNPKLLKAANLLTLCYVILGMRSRALELSKSVLYADIANPQALLYFNILCPDKSRPPVKLTGKVEKKESPSDVQATPIEQEGFFTSSMFMEALAFLLGILASIAVFVFLVIPGMNVEKTERITELESKIESMEGLARQIETNSESADSQEGASNTTSKDSSIAKANELYNNGDPVGAAQLIFGMDTKGASEESLEIYNSIIYNVTAAAANKLFLEGQKSYNAGSTEEASAYLSNALTYAENASAEESKLYNIKYNILLYQGRIAFDAGDNTTAVNLFSQIINSDADKKCQTYAENYLKSITEE